MSFTTKICILDYGSGNVASVFNMFKTIGVEVLISNRAEDIKNAGHLVLPGVGAFGAAMKKIKEKIPLEVLKEEVFEKKKPFLGICVGMQVLADKGYEFGEFDGLGWIKGSVKKLESGDLPLPHIGWNNLEIAKPVSILSALGENPDFYFVHSFAFACSNSEDIAATCDYGGRFTAVVVKENIYGVQFHPEKSQRSGKVLLSNFIKIQ